MDKENVVYIHKGISFSQKLKAILPLLTTLMNLEGILLNKLKIIIKENKMHHSIVLKKSTTTQVFIADRPGLVYRLWHLLVMSR